MFYPIFTYEDGTEVTASRPDTNGKITLYIEKFDAAKDSFINATIDIRKMTIESSNGYSDEELTSMLKEYSQIKDDIVDYIIEKEEWSH